MTPCCAGGTRGAPCASHVCWLTCVCVCVCVCAPARSCAPGELPEHTNLYIIHRGIVMHGLRVLTSGRMWGEETILLDASDVEIPTVARCMT